MVVNDLHLLWSGVCPYEADAPLVIDSDAVLSGTITFQRLESVSWREPKILQRLGGANLTKLSQRRRLNPRVDRRHAFATPQSLGDLVAKRLDHEKSI